VERVGGDPRTAHRNMRHDQGFCASRLGLRPAPGGHPHDRRPCCPALPSALRQRLVDTWPTPGRYPGFVGTVPTRPSARQAFAGRGSGPRRRTFEAGRLTQRDRRSTQPTRPFDSARLRPFPASSPRATHSSLNWSAREVQHHRRGDATPHLSPPPGVPDPHDRLRPSGTPSGIADRSDPSAVSGSLPGRIPLDRCRRLCPAAASPAQPDWADASEALTTQRHFGEDFLL
jgi:hypothetical protein